MLGQPERRRRGCRRLARAPAFPLTRASAVAVAVEVDPESVPYRLGPGGTGGMARVPAVRPSMMMLCDCSGQRVRSGTTATRWTSSAPKACWPRVPQTPRPTASSSMTIGPRSSPRSTAALAKSSARSLPSAASAPPQPPGMNGREESWRVCAGALCRGGEGPEREVGGLLLTPSWSPGGRGRVTSAPRYRETPDSSAPADQ